MKHFKLRYVLYSLIAVCIVVLLAILGVHRYNSAVFETHILSKTKHVLENHQTKKRISYKKFLYLNGSPYGNGYDKYNVDADADYVFWPKTFTLNNNIRNYNFDIGLLSKSDFYLMNRNQALVYTGFGLKLKNVRMKSQTDYPYSLNAFDFITEPYRITVKPNKYVVYDHDGYETTYNPTVYRYHALHKHVIKVNKLYHSGQIVNTFLNYSNFNNEEKYFTMNNQKYEITDTLGAFEGSYPDYIGRHLDHSILNQRPGANNNVANEMGNPNYPEYMSVSKLNIFTKNSIIADAAGCLPSKPYTDDDPDDYDDESPADTAIPFFKRVKHAIGATTKTDTALGGNLTGHNIYGQMFAGKLYDENNKLIKGNNLKDKYPHTAMERQVNTLSNPVNDHAYLGVIYYRNMQYLVTNLGQAIPVNCISKMDGKDAVLLSQSKLYQLHNSKLVYKKTAKENTLWFNGKHYKTIDGTKYLQIYTYTKVDWYGLKRLNYWVNADAVKH